VNGQHSNAVKAGTIEALRCNERIEDGHFPEGEEKRVGLVIDENGCTKRRRCFVTLILSITLTQHYTSNHAISLSLRKWLLPQALPPPHHRACTFQNYEGPTAGFLQAGRAFIKNSDWVLVLSPEDQPGTLQQRLDSQTLL